MPCACDCLQSEHPPAVGGLSLPPVRPSRRPRHVVPAGRLKSEEEARAEGSRFHGVQGPWYTVGCRMAVTVERALGRQAVEAGRAMGARAA